jgi:hypothetical protein
MEITFLPNYPRTSDKSKASMTAAGYLYINGSLSKELKIDDSKRYKPAVIKKAGHEYPALIEDEKGNKFSKTYNAYTMYAQGLKAHFSMRANLKLKLEPFQNKKQKGFILKDPDNPNWLVYSFMN